MIRVTFYFATGRGQSSHDCATVEEAYERCVRTNMDALVYPVGTMCGAYEWRARQDGHTLEGFRAKLEMCCNSVSEYEARLIDAGILKSHLPGRRIS